MMQLETDSNPTAGAPGEEQLRPAPRLLDGALFQRFATLPRGAIYALGLFLLLAGQPDNFDRIAGFLAGTVAGSHLAANGLTDVCLGVMYAAAMVNTWSVLRPEAGALSMLQAASGTGGAVPMISAAAERTIRRWRTGCVCWAGFNAFANGSVVISSALTGHWVIPPAGCKSDPSECSTVLVNIWAMIGTAMVVPTWLLSLKLAATLGAAKVTAVRSNAEALDVAACSPEEWEVQVRQPAIALAKEVLPALTEWGSGIGAVGIGAFGFWLCLVPEAVVLRDYSTLIIAGVLFLPIPLAVAVPPAGVSSSCNSLLMQLNELRCLEDGTACHERVFPLECYLTTVNKRQGIGFKIFSVVVDRTLLKQLALGIGGGVSTGLTFLLSIDEEVAEEESVLGAGFGGCSCELLKNMTGAATLTC